jgi:hypothetical protein
MLEMPKEFESIFFILLLILFVFTIGAIVWLVQKKSAPPQKVNPF